MVLLAGPGDTTDIVANWLDEHIFPVTVVTEGSQSRVHLTRRRIKRLGWVKTLGQVIFVAIAMPVLRIRGRRRRNQILSESSLNDTARPPDFRVDSVNSPRRSNFSRRLEPRVVVVNGTRIISSRVLDSIRCPIINTHAGTHAPLSGRPRWLLGLGGGSPRGSRNNRALGRQVESTLVESWQGPASIRRRPTR